MIIFIPIPLFAAGMRVQVTPAVYWETGVSERLQICDRVFCSINVTVPVGVD